MQRSDAEANRLVAEILAVVDQGSIEVVIGKHFLNLEPVAVAIQRACDAKVGAITHIGTIDLPHIERIGGIKVFAFRILDQDIAIVVISDLFPAVSVAGDASTQFEPQLFRKLISTKE